MAANAGRIEIIIDADDRATAKVRRFGSATEEVSNRGRRSFASLSASATSLVGVLGGLAAAVGAASVVAKITQIGAAFEQTMATVGGVMRATEAEMARLNDAARLMGETTEWSATQSGEALKYMGMAGMTAAQAVEALPGVLDLATAGQLDLGRATDIATDTLTALGMEVAELGRLNDVMVGTITRSNTGIEGMGAALRYVAPVAGQAGYDIEQVSAAIGVLANSGIKGEMAGTGLTQTFLKLDKAAKALGLESNDLVSVMRGIAEAQWSATEIAKVFGVEHVKTVSILQSNMGAYAELGEKLRSSQGEAKTLADTMRDTLSGAFKSLGAALESVALDVFDRFGGALKNATNALADFIRENKASLLGFIDAFNSAMSAAAEPIRAFVANNRELWVNLRADVETAFAGVQFAVEAGAGVINAAMSQAVQWVRDRSAEFQSVGADIKNAIITPLSGLAAAIEEEIGPIGSIGETIQSIFQGQVVPKLEAFGGVVSRVFDEIALPAMERVGGWVSGNGSEIEGFFSDVGGVVSTLSDALTTAVGHATDFSIAFGKFITLDVILPVLENIGGAVSDAIDYFANFKDTFQGAFDALQTAADAAWAGFSSAFGNIESAVGTAGDSIQGAGHNATTFADTIQQTFEGRIVPAIESFSGWIDENQSSIESFFTGLGNVFAALVETGGDVVAFLADLIGWLGHLGVVDGFVGALDRVVSVAESVAQSVKTAIGHISDFVVWLSSAAADAKDKGGQIIDAIAAIPAEVEAIGARIGAALDAAFQDLVSLAVETAEDIKAKFRAIPDAITGIVSDIKGKFDGAMDGVSGAVGGAWDRVKGIFGDDVEANVNITGTGSTKRPITEKIAEIEGRFGDFSGGLASGMEANIAIQADAGNGSAPFTAAIDGARAAYEARIAEIEARRRESLSRQVADTETAAQATVEAHQAAASSTVEATEKAAQRVVQAEKKAAEQTVAAHKKAAGDRKRIVEDFARVYDEQMLDTYDLELKRLDEQRAEYEAAGADKLKVSEWYWKEYGELTQRAFEDEKRQAERAAQKRKRMEEKLYRDLGSQSAQYRERQLAEIERQVEAFRDAGLEEADIAEWKSQKILEIEDNRNQEIESGMSGIGDLFQDIAAGNIRTWQDMATNLVGVFGNMLSEMGGQSDGFLGSIGSALGGIGKKISGLFSGGGSGGHPSGGASGGLFSSIAGGLGSIFGGGGLGGLGDIAGSLLGGGGGIGGMASSLLGGIGGMFSEDAGAIGSGMGSGAGIGMALGGPIGAGIGALAGGLFSGLSLEGEKREVMDAGEFGFRDTIRLGSRALNEGGDRSWGQESLAKMQQAQETVFASMDQFMGQLPADLARAFDRTLSAQQFDVGGKGYNIREDHKEADLATNSRAVVYDMWREAVLPAMREFGGDFASTLDESVYSKDVIRRFREFTATIDEEHQHGITTSQQNFEAFLERMQGFQGDFMNWLQGFREIDALSQVIGGLGENAAEMKKPATQFEKALDQAVAEVEAGFADTRDRLSGLGFPEVKLDKYEAELRAHAEESVRAQFSAQRDALLDQAAKAAGKLEEGEGLSAFENAMADTEAQFQSIADQMHQLGGDAEDLARVQDLQAAAVANVRSEFEAARGEVMATAESMAGMTNAMSPFDAVVADVNNQFDNMAARMRNLGAAQVELARIEETRQQAILRQTGDQIFGQVDMASILKSGIEEGMAAMEKAGRREAELKKKVAATVRAISEATTYEELAALDEKLAGYRSALDQIGETDFSRVGAIVNKKIQGALTSGMRDFAIQQVAGNIQQQLVSPFVDQLAAGFLEGGFNVETMQRAFQQIQSLDVGNVSAGIAEVFSAMEAGENIDWQGFADKYGAGLEAAFGDMVPTEAVQEQAAGVGDQVAQMTSAASEGVAAMAETVAGGFESMAASVSGSVEGLASAASGAASRIASAAARASAVSGGDAAPDASLAVGAWSIPKDGFMAELHAGEAVIRREDAPAVRAFLEATGLSGKYGRAAKTGPVPSYAAGTLSAEPPEWLTEEAAARWAELQKGGASAPSRSVSRPSSSVGSSVSSGTATDTADTADDIARIMEEAARLVSGLRPRTLNGEVTDLTNSFADLSARLQEAGGSAEQAAQIEAHRAEALSLLGRRMAADLSGPLADMTAEIAEWSALNIGGKTREGLAVEKADAFRAANPDMSLDDLNQFVQLEQAAYAAQFDRLSDTWQGWQNVEADARAVAAEARGADAGPVLRSIPDLAGESVEDVSAYVEGMGRWINRASALRDEFASFADSIRAAQADIAQEVRAFGMSDAGKARLLSRDIAAGQRELSGLSGQEGLDRAKQLQRLVMDRYELEKRQISDVKSSVEALAGLTDKIQQKIFDLQYSDFNLAKGVERQDMAAQDYAALLRAAQGGDASAVEDYLGFVDTYLKQSQETYKSSEQYRQIWESVNADMERLGVATERQLSTEERHLSGIQAAANRTNAELNQLAAYAERQAALIQTSIDTETANMEALFGEGGAIRQGQQATENAIAAMKEGLQNSIEEMKVAVVAAVSESGDRPVEVNLELNGRALTDNIVADIKTRTKNREQVF